MAVQRGVVWVGESAFGDGSVELVGSGDEPGVELWELHHRQSALLPLLAEEADHMPGVAHQIPDSVAAG